MFWEWEWWLQVCSRCSVSIRRQRDGGGEQTQRGFTSRATTLFPLSITLAPWGRAAQRAATLRAGCVCVRGTPPGVQREHRVRPDRIWTELEEERRLSDKKGGGGGGERRENTNPHNHVSLFVRLKVSPDKQTGAPLHSSELLPWQHRLLRRPGAHKASLCEPKMFVRIRKRCLKEFLVVFLSPRMMFADTTPTSLCVVFVMFCRIFILLAHCDLEVPHK